MSHIETATHRATQATDVPFQARIKIVWGVWIRLANKDYLKGVFSREADARAHARQAAGAHNLAEVRQMRVLLNVEAREAYLLGDPSDPLLAVDVDFQHKLRKDELRAQALARLSPEERAALGIDPKS